MSWSLTGLDALRERLERELAANRLHHAPLLTGPAGVGKRSVALLLAEALLCETRVAEGHPLGCGDCGSCHRVQKRQHSDLHILERPAGKTVIPVEQVRQLLADFSRAELEGRGRVAILHDVEQLGREGQNALLKTLEEPERRRWLILTASRPELLLDTVRSRAQRVPVPTLPGEELAALLSREHGVAPELATRLAQIAQGSVGRALALHEEGLEPWERRLAPLRSGHGGAEAWIRGIFEDLDTGDEGLRYGKRLRAERALGLAVIFARERAHGGEEPAWEEISELLEARRQLERGIAPELVLRALWDRRMGASGSS
jgi:DNA polymerase-3 subunit delta'